MPLAVLLLRVRAARVRGVEVRAEIRSADLGVNIRGGVIYSGVEIPVTLTSPKMSCCARLDTSEPRYVARVTLTS